MKRLIALLLVLGLLGAVAGINAARLEDEKDKKDKDSAKKDKDSAKKDKDSAKKDDKKDKDSAKKDGDKKDGDKKDGDKKDKGKEPPKVDLTPAQKGEVKKLSGTFTVVSYEHEGKKKEAADIKKMKVVQDGAEWRFYENEDITLGRDTPFPDKSPKEIDSYYINGSAREKTVKGIYKIDGDTVTYVHADVGKDRPKDFSTGKTGSGLTMIVLKKVKDEDKDKDGKKDKDKEKPKDKEKSKDKVEKKDKDKDGKKEEGKKKDD